MCGRYRLSRRKQTIEEHFETADWQDDWSPRYNIAPDIVMGGACETVEVGLTRGLAVAIFALFFSLASANAQEAPVLRVLISGGFRAAYHELVPEFERRTGHSIVTTYGGSMGNAPNSIPNRLERGEPADVVILASSALEELVKKHEVIEESRVDLARSMIAMAVRAGTHKPNISTLDALKRTLLAAKSIAYSDSVSGVYLSTELFQRLGIADAIRSKCIRVEVEMVGTVIARGDAEIGFQQLSELRPIAGVDIVGLLPPEAQKITVFSGGVPVHSKQPSLAKQFLHFLASPEAAAAIEKSGLQPVTEQTAPRKSAVPSGDHVRETNGSMSAASSGTPSIREECAQRAFTIGRRRSASLVVYSRRIRDGTGSEAQ